MIGRRGFITGAATAVAAPFVLRQARAANLRIRRDVQSMAPNDPWFTKYGQAIQAMHDLQKSKPSDQRNWRNQALIHINHCPHSSNSFVHWHRHYILIGTRAWGKGLSGGERGKAAGRDAIGLPELARHVALVGKAAGERRVRQGRTLPDQCACAVEAPHRQIAVRTGAETGAEMARERVAREACRMFQSGRRHCAFGSIEKVAGNIDGAQAGTPNPARCARRIRSRERQREIGNDLRALQILQRRIEIVQRRRDRAHQPCIARHRVAHERQRRAPPSAS